MAKTTDELCPRCFIGRLVEGVAPYVIAHEGQLIAVSDARAFTCDICDYREFDDVRVEWIVKTLNTTDTDANNPTNPLQSTKYTPKS